MPKSRICSVLGCDKPIRCRGLCKKHYEAEIWRRTLANPDAQRCSIPDCDGVAKSHGYCAKHYQRLWRHGTTELSLAPPRLCSVPGCDRPYKSNGCCSMHQRRLMRHGSPTGGGAYRRPKGEALRWLHEVAIPYESDECLLWPFSFFPQGYGQVIDEKGKGRSAHNVVAEMKLGPRPKGLVVAHNCGNRACVNPGHLRYDTQAGNLADRVLHDTHFRGERHHHTRLTNDDVREIRRLAGSVRPRDLMKKYGIAKSTLYSIIHRLTWKSID